jgi:hypothetical protein
MKLSELKREANQCVKIFCEYVLANSGDVINCDTEDVADEVIKLSIELNDEISQCETHKQIIKIIKRELPDFVNDPFLLKYKKECYKDIAWKYIIDKAHVDGKYDDRLLKFYSEIDNSNSKKFDKLKSIIDVSPNYIRVLKYNDKPELEQEIVYMMSLLETHKIPYIRKGYYFELPVNMKITLRGPIYWETPFSYSKSKSMDTKYH